MKNYLPGLLLAFALISWTIDDFPQAVITNGSVRATLYLPDTATGYYRGTRFDWSGSVASLDYKGHSYFGKWFEKYDPFLHDAITGPVEAFDPLGYDQAKPGDLFVKIGVGSLRKIDNEPYKFVAPYQHVDKGRWSVQKKGDQVRFTHVLNDAAGYSYQYEKTVRLTKGKPELVLEHRLKNTGNQRIETAVYNHNFLVIDQQPSGPDFRVQFGFAARPTGDLKDILASKNQDISFLRPLQNRESIYTLVEGYGANASDYDIRVENTKTGAGVRIRADRPLAKLAFWSNPKNLSPEPFIAIKVEPGQEFTWKIAYEFYTIER
ncbi:hypothetical protein GCM10028803_42150 [Larkinella knui]|uniref:DUF4380 domain-containing protein n=1 Tax=Larkinella knui TaxID=2025310 RepID=A0A3P1CPG3_9BACT|nr:hypothetical protein [Larkinella knui]RRB14844.1 hypothetical protein EHT87_09765 [Larkinella knui]